MRNVGNNRRIGLAFEGKDEERALHGAAGIDQAEGQFARSCEDAELGIPG
jgi:hypothetical protein